GYLEALGVMIENYESEHFPVSGASGIDALKYLMDEHGLKQDDLSEIGSQGVVSEILHGRRTLNTRQIRDLAKRFGVSPAVFIDD
ncbi:MAG: transcriptional regulator, partial [Candidatus Omnitrophica bacterium CG12_big_fil_rev_8_21_14_0_65_50_5]